MGDNGGFGRDGVGQVEALARGYGFTVTDSIIFSPTATSFAAEATRRSGTRMRRRCGCGR